MRAAGVSLPSLPISCSSAPALLSHARPYADSEHAHARELARARAVRRVWTSTAASGWPSGRWSPASWAASRSARERMSESAWPRSFKTRKGQTNYHQVGREVWRGRQRPHGRICSWVRLRTRLCALRRASTYWAAVSAPRSIWSRRASRAPCTSAVRPTPDNPAAAVTPFTCLRIHLLSPSYGWVCSAARVLVAPPVL